MREATWRAIVARLLLAAKVLRERVPLRARRIIVSLVALAGLAAFMLDVSLGRMIDGDEGYFLMAARLVSEGKVPYRDFFLPQGPVLPALFGLCFWAMGRSWVIGRAIAGALAVLMGLLVYRQALSATGRRAAAIFATILFAFSGMTIGWLTIVKGFGLAALCMLAASSLVGVAVGKAQTHSDHRTIAAGAAGLAIGLAASTRLYTLAIMPTLALYLVCKLGLHRSSARRLGGYGLGCVVGLLPLIVSYAVDRQAFVFDTILFHGIREYGQDSLLGSLTEKAPIALKALGFDREASLGNRQLMGMALMATMAMLARIRVRGDVGSSAAWIWPVLLAVSVLPNPFLPQYFCLLVPFLAIESGLLLAAFLDGWQRSPRLWPAAVAACAMVYLVYHVGVGWMERDRYLRTGEGVPGVMSTDRVSRWRIDTVEGVARGIDALGFPVAASWWPGYFISSRTNITLVLANDFGLRAGEVLSPKLRRRFHVASSSDVNDMIRQSNPRLFVEGNWANLPLAAQLPAYGYQNRGTIHNVRLWALK